ncbi:hypothetical protein PsorP6_003875 [Peronosclerospora sorghi]|uniref:Uncharacterized protein n=1 Tax=Peronosclerospora sorghi TaxID=230839 RepID=A0ACC0VRV4_9STRA|nr:hypothetical protein PsorP6_003875 [Peronosclerospora sorghi]
MCMQGIYESDIDRYAQDVIVYLVTQVYVKDRGAIVYLAIINEFKAIIVSSHPPYIVTCCSTVSGSKKES